MDRKVLNKRARVFANSTVWDTFCNRDMKFFVTVPNGIPILRACLSNFDHRQARKDLISVYKNAYIQGYEDAQETLRQYFFKAQEEAWY